MQQRSGYYDGLCQFCNIVTQIRSGKPRICDNCAESETRTYNGFTADQKRQAAQIARENYAAKAKADAERYKLLAPNAAQHLTSIKTYLKELARETRQERLAKSGDQR